MSCVIFLRAMATNLCFAAAAAWRGTACHECVFTVQKRFFAICPLRPSLHKGTVYYRVPNPYIPVILLRSVRGLGVRGQVIQTRRGTLRNFLLPQKLAVVASWQNIDKNYLLAQEDSRLTMCKPADKSVDPTGASVALSLPAGIFERVSRAAPNGLYGSADGYRATTTRSTTERDRNISVYTNSSDSKSGDNSNAGAAYIGTHPVVDTGGQDDQTDRISLEAGTQTHTYGRSESETGPFGSLKGYCARFVVDTDHSNPVMVRGKGVSMYDILSKLSEEVHLDLVPQQAQLTVTRAREDLSLPELRPQKRAGQESLRNAGDLEHFRSNFEGNKEYNQEEAGQEMGLNHVLRTCGSYEASLRVPMRQGALVVRKFSVLLVSKQEIARGLRAKRLRQKAEALRADFSLGPNV